MYNKKSLIEIKKWLQILNQIQKHTQEYLDGNGEKGELVFNKFFIGERVLAHLNHFCFLALLPTTTAYFIYQSQLFVLIVMIIFSCNVDVFTSAKICEDAKLICRTPKLINESEDVFLQYPVYVISGAVIVVVVDAYLF